MKIPKKLKIAGKTYTVHFKLDHQTGNSQRANVYFWQQKIWIDKNQHQEGKEESLLHEILEIIKEENNLKDISHQSLSTLSQNFYQVLKDNKLTL